MKLNATLRTVFGKKLVPHRKQDKIPAVIYAKHLKEPVAIFFEKNEFIKLYREAGKSTPITIVGNWIEELVLIHEISVHPVTTALWHVDFLGVKKGQAVNAEVELVYINESPVEKNKLGRVEQLLDSVTVKADPTKLPKNIEVDLSTIETLQDVIFVKDLKVAKDVEIENDPEQAVATAVEFSTEVVEETSAESTDDTEAAA